MLAEQTAGDPGMTHFIAEMDALDLIAVYRAARCCLLQRLGPECDVALGRLGGL
ncbi:hypothetical protein [Nonomuraea jabiensis]|uniref:hypothetical protein n=1 Tax=Nonomuraea jabiensis TaxID=882448 RepID=UPI003D723BA5